MTCSLSAIQVPPNRTRIRRRNSSTYNSLLGSDSGTRNRPIAPVESGPCCQDSPTALTHQFDDQEPAAATLCRKHRKGQRYLARIHPLRLEHSGGGGRFQEI